ncbi:hypothetical protein TREES_T100017628 [Tupaia chinensis]|uniref:Uncharacterized protein n=1 Tax=Tupaia chinensis TaxID=246437 RepID=L9L4A0_TUPCH|nr:hypothetical protein TREES_T100017628 [Tupaia chinensis]
MNSSAFLIPAAPPGRPCGPPGFARHLVAAIAGGGGPSGRKPPDPDELRRGRASPRGEDQAGGEGRGRGRVRPRQLPEASVHAMQGPPTGHCRPRCPGQTLRALCASAPPAEPGRAH